MIKALALEQTALKAKRKTGTVTYKGSFYQTPTDPELVRQQQILLDSFGAASDVRDNKIRITAALNLYHEIRNSDYRHKTPDHALFYYKKFLDEIRLTLQQRAV